MTPCALCKATETITQFQSVQDYLTGASFAIERCTRCGLAFTIPQPGRLDQYYPQQYRQFGPFTRMVLQFLYIWKARAWIRTLRTQGTALEIGAGAGWMLRALRRHGWKVIGNERCIQSSVVALAKDGLPVFVGELDALRSGAQFGLIILFQVLEHLKDPEAALRHCVRLLAPGGTLVVAVPNLDSWQARICGESWFHLDVPRHLFHFTPSSLTQALEKVGLRVATINFSSLEHDPYGWVQSIMNKLCFKQNQLTRLLMGIDKWGANRWGDFGVIALSAILLVPSVIAAVWSSRVHAGALMQVSATKPYA